MHKVYIILPSRARGGSERVLTNLAEMLVRHKSQCKVIYLSDVVKNGYSFSGYSVVYAGSFVPNMLLQLPKELASLGCNDIVLASQFYLNVWIALLKLVGLCRAKTVARESTRVFVRFKGWKRQIAKMGVYLLYQKHDLVIAQTDEMAKDIKVHNTRANVIKLDNPFHAPVLSDHIVLPDHIIQSPFFVAAGRLITLKRFDFLIEAFANVPTEYPLVIIGEGPERIALTALVEKLGLSERIFLAGEVDNPSDYFQRALCCVVSSELEGFPNVLLEMMYSNGTVVSTRCADGIDDLPGLITCEPNDLEGMIESLRRALLISDEVRVTNRIRMREYLSKRTHLNYWHKISGSLMQLT